MNFKLFSKNSILSPHDKKQRQLLVILIVVVLITLVILYFGLRRSSLPSSVDTGMSNAELFPTEKIGAISDEAPKNVIKKINFDADFLKNSYFEDLKIYGEWPLQVDKKGRDNPFLPY